VCGGPRIPLEKGDHLPEDAAPALKKAGDLRTSGALWRLTSWASAFMAALGIGGAVVMAPYSIATAIVFGAIGISLVVATLGWRRRASERAVKSRETWEKAWDFEVEQLLAKGSLTPKQIARKVRIPEEDVEKIIARLSATDRVRVEVGTGELRVSVTDISPTEEESDEEAPGAHARRR
jgi:hypothetical protein